MAPGVALALLGQEEGTGASVTRKLVCRDQSSHLAQFIKHVGGKYCGDSGQPQRKNNTSWHEEVWVLPKNE